VGRNLDHARPFIQQAAEQGAKLLLLPELYPTGYLQTPDIWNAGETADGPTVRFLREQASQFRVHIGTSFLEADGEDFYDAFVLLSPNDRTHKVRKQRAPSYEAYWFRGSSEGPCVIDCELGRISVGICADNHFGTMAECIERNRAQLHLMPHCYPIAREHPIWFPAALAAASRRQLETLPARYAGHFGIPVVLANQVGPWISPLPSVMGSLVQSDRFLGRSAIVLANGTVVRSLGEEEEGVIVETVTLRPESHRCDERKIAEARGWWGWSALGDPEFATASLAFQIETMERLGRWGYQRSTQRRRCAARIASGR
jgi:N-carbamoylputrescine amidase